MRTEKLSLKNIKNVLSRTEMKKIMAGSGSPCGAYDAQCGVPGQPATFPPCCQGLNCVGEGPFGAFCV